MGLLDGGMEAIFGAALGGLYLPATLHVLGTPIEDVEGNVIGHTGDADYSCRAQLDDATWSMRQADGYADGDQRIIVLSAGMTVGITTDNEITIRGKRWMIESVQRDAAASHWVLRGRAR